MPGLGKIQRRIKRAFVANQGSPLTTSDLARWCYPRQKPALVMNSRFSIWRPPIVAVKVGRTYPGGFIWVGKSSQLLPRQIPTVPTQVKAGNAKIKRVESLRSDLKFQITWANNLSRACWCTTRAFAFIAPSVKLFAGQPQRFAMKERKTSQIVTRVTPAERAWLEQEADKRGMGLRLHPDGAAGRCA